MEGVCHDLCSRYHHSNIRRMVCRDRRCRHWAILVVTEDVRDCARVTKKKNESEPPEVWVADVSSLVVREMQEPQSRLKGVLELSKKPKHPIEAEGVRRQKLLWVIRVQVYGE